MPPLDDRIALPGSERFPPAGGRPSGGLDPNERILVTMVVRSRAAGERLEAVNELARRRLQDRKYLTREELASRFGATREDITKVEDFARQHGPRAGRRGSRRTTRGAFGSSGGTGGGLRGEACPLRASEGRQPSPHGTHLHPDRPGNRGRSGPRAGRSPPSQGPLSPPHQTGGGWGFVHSPSGGPALRLRPGARTEQVSRWR